MFLLGDAMLSEMGYNLHLVAFDEDGNLIANVAFPNALDSACGCFTPPTKCSYVGASLTTLRVVYGESLYCYATEDMEVWGVVSSFHRLQPLLDPDGRPMKVRIPKGAFVYVYSYPKSVRKVGAPSDPIDIQVYSSQLGVSGPISAQLYWLDSSVESSIMVYSDGTVADLQPSLMRVSDVRRGSATYCRMLIRLDASSSKSISYFIIAPDVGPVAPFKVQFPSPVTPQYFCGSRYPVLVRVDLPRG